MSSFISSFIAFINPEPNTTQAPINTASAPTAPTQFPRLLALGTPSYSALFRAIALGTTLSDTPHPLKFSAVRKEIIAGVGVSAGAGAAPGAGIGCFGGPIGAAAGGVIGGAIGVAAGVGCAYFYYDSAKTKHQALAAQLIQLFAGKTIADLYAHVRNQDVMTLDNRVSDLGSEAIALTIHTSTQGQISSSISSRKNPNKPIKLVKPKYNNQVNMYGFFLACFSLVRVEGRPSELLEEGDAMTGDLRRHYFKIICSTPETPEFNRFLTQNSDHVRQSVNQDRLSTMTVQYMDFLKAIDENRAIDPSNPFSRIQNECTLVKGSSADQIRLAFSNDYLQAISTITDRDFSDPSKISYDFVLLEPAQGSASQLVIRHTERREPIIFATFDSTTVRCFHDRSYERDQRRVYTWGSDHHPRIPAREISTFHMAELLFTFMNAGLFAGNNAEEALDMPSNKTVTFTGGRVSSSGLPFAGGYLLSKNHPNSIIHVNSSEFNEEMSQATFNAVNGQDPNWRTLAILLRPNPLFPVSNSGTSGVSHVDSVLVQVDQTAQGIIDGLHSQPEQERIAHEAIFESETLNMARVVALNTQLAELEQRHTMDVSELASTAARERVAQETIEGLRFQLNEELAARGALLETETRMLARVTELNAQLIELEQRHGLDVSELTSAAARNHSAQETIEGLRFQLNEELTAHDALLESETRIMARVTELNTQLAELEQRHTMDVSELTSAAARQGSLSSRISEIETLKDTIKTLTSSEKSSQNALALFRLVLQRKIREGKNTQQRLNATKKTVAELVTRVSELEQLLLEKEAELKIANERIKELETELDVVKRDRDQALHDLEEAIKEISVLQTEINRLQAIIDNIPEPTPEPDYPHDYIRQLKEEIETLTRLVHEKETIILVEREQAVVTINELEAKTKSEIAAQVLKVTEMNEDLSRLRHTQNSLVQQIQESKFLLEQAKSEFERLSNEIIEHKQKISVQEKQLKIGRQLHHNTQQRVSELEDQLDAHQTKILKLRGLRAQHKGEIEGLYGMISDMAGEIARLRRFARPLDEGEFSQSINGIAEVVSIVFAEEIDNSEFDKKGLKFWLEQAKYHKDAEGVSEELGKTVPLNLEMTQRINDALFEGAIEGTRARLAEFFNTVEEIDSFIEELGDAQDLIETLIVNLDASLIVCAEELEDFEEVEEPLETVVDVAPAASSSYESVHKMMSDDKDRLQFKKLLDEILNQITEISDCSNDREIAKSKMIQMQHKLKELTERSLEHINCKNEMLISSSQLNILNTQEMYARFMLDKMLEEIEKANPEFTMRSDTVTYEAIQHMKDEISSRSSPIKIKKGLYFIADDYRHSGASKALQRAAELQNTLAARNKTFNDSSSEDSWTDGEGV